MTNITVDINYCATRILNGDLVAFPTETVYGLGANIYNENAINKIFKYKERPNSNPLIIHIYNFNQLIELTELKDEELKIVKKITDIFWPGALTLILPKSKKVNYNLTAGTEFVGIRMPSNKIALDLLKKSNVPIAAPSANKYCHVSPTNYKHVIEDFKNKELTIIPNDKEILDIGIESSIFGFDFKNKIFELLRPGFITINMMSNVLPEFTYKINSKKDNVPGSHNKHYAINKKTFLLTDSSEITFDKNKVSFIDFTSKYQKCNFNKYYSISTEFNYIFAMQNLYNILREVEKDNTEYLIIYLPKENNQNYDAIYNRLIRCCSGNIIKNNTLVNLKL